MAGLALGGDDVVAHAGAVVVVVARGGVQPAKSRGRKIGVPTICECGCVSEAPAPRPKFLNTTAARISGRSSSAR